MPRRARIALIGTAVGLALMAVTWYAKSYSGLINHADRSILSGFAGLHRPGVDRLASFFAHLCDPKPYVLLLAIPLVEALVRRRPRVAAAIVLISFGANASSQILKPLLAEPHLGSLFGFHHLVDPASWPSGHATAAMSLALCCVIAAPTRWRPRIAAVMAAFTVVVCYSFLELGWHYPSDVLGGFLLAVVWALFGTAVLETVNARWPGRRSPAPGPLAAPVSLSEALTPVAAVVLGAIGLALIVAIARPHAVVSYAQAHAAFMVGATGIGVLSLMIATGAVLALRR